MLLKAATAPPSLLRCSSRGPSTPAAAAAAERRETECLLLRLVLHYQTLFCPLRAPLSLFRCLYRRLLFPPAPRRQRINLRRSVAAADGRQRCCCCSSEEEYTGADDPDSDTDDCSNSTSSTTSSSTNSSSSNNNNSSSNSSRSYICMVCLRRQRARAARRSRLVLREPCAFYYREQGGPRGAPRGPQPEGPPEDLWRVTLQFSLFLPVRPNSQPPVSPAAAVAVDAAAAVGPAAAAACLFLFLCLCGSLISCLPLGLRLC